MTRSESLGPFFGRLGRLTRFGSFNLTSCITLAVITLVLSGSPRVEAQIIVNTPAGLIPGDTFRIAFVTDSYTRATSSDIATYNAFVNADANTEAGGGSVTYNGTTLTFSAIGSTSAVNAITNIGQTGSPVYIINGTEVASSDTSAAHGLWSGGLLSAISMDLVGAPPILGIQMWTGSASTGVGAAGDQLGAGFDAETGHVYNDYTWASFGYYPSAQGFPMYGISQSLTVVPEPSSIVLLLSAAGCGAVGAYVRRRKARGGR